MIDDELDGVLTQRVIEGDTGRIEAVASLLSEGLSDAFMHNRLNRPTCIAIIHSGQFPPKTPMRALDTAPTALIPLAIRATSSATSL